jgi:hypothetical protein
LLIADIKRKLAVIIMFLTLFWDPYFWLLLFIVWAISVIVNYLICRKKRIPWAKEFLISGPISTYILIKYKEYVQTDFELKSLFQKIDKTKTGSDMWLFYNFVIKTINDYSLSRKKLKKAKYYCKSVIDLRNAFMSVNSVVATIIITMALTLGVYFMTALDTQKQREYEDMEKGSFSYSLIEYHTLNGEKKSYDFDSFLRISITYGIFASIFFEIISSLQHLKRTRKFIVVLNAIEYMIDEDG